MNQRLILLAAGLLAGVLLLPAAADAAQCLGSKVTITGTSGNDTITGTERSDVIDARSGNDLIRSRAGDDLICLGPGNDGARSGPGEDEILKPDTNGVNEQSQLRTGSGDDEVTLAAAGASTADSDFNYVITGSGDDRVDSNHPEIGVQIFDLGDGSDRLTVSSLSADTVLGGDGSDRVRSSDDEDSVYGEAGDDNLDLGSGPDRGYGGSGDDTVDLGSGADRGYGGSGDDTVQSSSTGSPIILDGGSGDDLMDARSVNPFSASTFTLHGRSGSDLIMTGGNGLTFYGDEGDDEFQALDGMNDTCDGGSGTDTETGCSTLVNIP